MLKAVSTYVYVKERLHPGLLDELVKAGAQSIEIFAARQHFDYANRKRHVSEIADWFETLAKAEKSHAGRFQRALDSLD